MNHIEKMCRDHFNEPVLLIFEVGRLIGYAEDDHDSYLIVQMPYSVRHKEGNGIIYHTAVGGYIFLDVLKDKERVVGTTGEVWDDFYRLDSVLERNGAPKVAEFVVKHFPAERNAGTSGSQDQDL